MMLQSVLNLYQHVLLKRTKTLSLPPSIANPYQLFNSSSSFRLLVICFVTDLVSICVVFMQPHMWYFFTILEHGNMFLNILAAWSGVLKGGRAQQKKIEKSSPALTTSRSNFAVAELTPKWVYFLCRSLSSISISLIFWGALVSDHIIFYSMYNTKIAFTHSHTVHTAKPSLFQDFSISLNLLHHKSLIFSQYFSLTELALNCLSL